MRHIEIDMPDLLVAGPDHQYFLWRLDEVYRAGSAHHVEVGNACGRA